MRGRGSWVAAALAACAVALAGAGRAEAIAVTEFPMPVPASSPLGIAAGADGNVWFTEVSGSRVGRVTPGGEVTDFSNGSGVSTGGRKWDIAAGPDGNLWYTDESSDVVGRMTPPATAVEFPVAVSTASLGPRGIAAGPDGNLWVAADAGAIVRVSPAGAPTEFTAGITSGARPLDIAAGPDGALWFTEQAGRIGRITTAGAITEFSSGITPAALPSGIAAGSDGALWFTEYIGNRIGRITTAGVVTEFPGLSPSAQPRSITAGPDGNLWFTEENVPRLGRITTAGVVTEYPVALAAGGRPAEITRGPGRDLWITTAAGNRVARVRLQPTVTTGAASAITQTSARIAGTVDPFVSSTGHVVEYGRTTAYGSATEAQIVPPAAAAVPVTVPLSGLAPGTRYHYRLVGSSFGGTTDGADATFTTTGAPGTGGAGTSSRDLTGPRVQIAGTALVARRGRISISLGCPLAETLGCRGRVRLVRVPSRGVAGRPAAPLRLGSAPFRIGGGQTAVVVIRLTPRARALLRARGALRVRAVARAVDAAGNDRETGRRLALRRG